jgi:hypothetical protein
MLSSRLRLSCSQGAEAKVWPDDSCTQSEADSKDITDRQHAAVTHGRQVKTNPHARADPHLKMR